MSTWFCTENLEQRNRSASLRPEERTRAVISYRIRTTWAWGYHQRSRPFPYPYVPHQDTCRGNCGLCPGAAVPQQQPPACAASPAVPEQPTAPAGSTAQLWAPAQLGLGARRCSVLVRAGVQHQGWDHGAVVISFGVSWEGIGKIRRAK